MESYETTWLLVNPDYKILSFAAHEFRKVAVLWGP